jgi:phospholipid/cholesterol/gamma-HCH transport system substrate-binding protein
MEIRARYVLIGTFVLAFTLGMFGFVYWIKNTGGFGQRTSYEIRFEQPVSGLTVGSSVLFNGVRVGAITALTLDPQKPKQLTVSIAVDPTTPIRSDTQVDVTYQGLTGAPAVALKGGAAGAPPLTAQNGRPPALVAPPGVGQNLTEAARGTLHHIDSILADNSKDLHTAISGFSTFADMLGRNSKRLESVIGGLEKLTGGGEKKPEAVFDLTAAKDFPGVENTITQHLVVPDPSSILTFDTQRILVRNAQGVYSHLEDAKWADTTPKLMQARVLQSFENAGQLSMVSRPFEQAEGAYRLELTIRSFNLTPAPAPAAMVAFSARILDNKGTVVAARVFDASAPAKSLQPADAVAALDAAFGKAAHALVVWAVGLL